MTKEEWNEGLNQLDPALVEEYVQYKDRLQQKNRNPGVKWLRWGAIAAAFLMIISAAIAVQMIWANTPAIEPYFPNGEAWSPVINWPVKEITLTADQAGSVFDEVYDGVGTNQYTKVYAAKPEYLELTPLPNAEYLPIYSSRFDRPTKESLGAFIDKYLDTAASFFGMSVKEYEIRSDPRDGYTDYSAFIRENEKILHFDTRKNLLYFHFDDLDDCRLQINGSRVSLLESDTDDQIAQKLEDTVTAVCTAFGKQYTDIEICRYYSDDQLVSITAYLYSAEETIFPENFSKTPMTSDYIALTFHTDLGSGHIYEWGGSKDEAFLTDISFYQVYEKWNSCYRVDAKVKMLPLEEAERLLEKGYVFGGHSCSLCMAKQPEVDFSEYDYVEVEYVSDKNGNMYVPFYAFSKNIGQSEYGIDIYAKTYVPAVLVIGYEDYFEKQTDSHRS